MPEVSERERSRRKADADASSVNKAQSFRLGKLHMEKLRKMARRSDLQQVAILRKLIDMEYKRMFPVV